MTSDRDAQNALTRMLSAGHLQQAAELARAWELSTIQWWEALGDAFDPALYPYQTLLMASDPKRAASAARLWGIDCARAAMPYFLHTHNDPRRLEHLLAVAEQFATGEVAAETLVPDRDRLVHNLIWTGLSPLINLLSALLSEDDGQLITGRDVSGALGWETARTDLSFRHLGWLIQQLHRSGWPMSLKIEQQTMLYRRFGALWAPTGSGLR
ncbi:MAG: hypothetical protein AAFV53_04680 [Myxococcota bacterium]